MTNFEGDEDLMGEQQLVDQILKRESHGKLPPAFTERVMTRIQRRSPDRTITIIKRKK